MAADLKVTPLMSAAGTASLADVVRLIEAGADVHALSADGSSALHYAAEAISWVTDDHRRTPTRK